jgi:formate-dependent phosphoribosylglycinamide formyltransferase (GAR transformylase)
MLQALLDANDFIGLSAYGSGYPTDASQLTYRSAEVPLYTLAYELSFFGIDLKAYMDRPVLYVEQVSPGACCSVSQEIQAATPPAGVTELGMSGLESPGRPI